MAFSTRCLRSSRVSRERGPGLATNVLYEGRADIVVPEYGDTSHAEAFCMWLRTKHGVKARPGAKPRYSRAWPAERVAELYAVFTA